jgi:acyl carrier protein phosphodiesterase
MNYLAHAYLSFNHPEILVGNMISDYVKGKTKFNYSKAIQNGIMYHREIDTYTDNHLIIKEAKKIFQPNYRLYSGAFIDVVIDHYLAKKLQQEINFEKFTVDTYTTLQNFEAIFPIVFKKMFTSMQQHNWLYNYQFNWAMEKSFQGLQRRALYISEVQTAFILFENNYNQLDDLFNLFWKDLYDFSFITYNSISNEG